MRRVAKALRYQAVVWLSITGDVLNGTQQAAFESYVRGGGGYVGVHAAADTEHSWPWHGGLVGACFTSHPAIQQASLRHLSEDRRRGRRHGVARGAEVRHGLAQRDPVVRHRFLPDLRYTPDRRSHPGFLRD